VECHNSVMMLLERAPIVGKKGPCRQGKQKGEPRQDKESKWCSY
jgi:hypothetical protein